MKIKKPLKNLFENAKIASVFKRLMACTASAVKLLMGIASKNCLTAEAVQANTTF